MSQSRDLSREKFWREAVAAWQRSGQTIRAFCAARRLSEASLYAWRRELARRDRERRPGVRELSLARPKSAAAKFIPLQVLPSVLIEVVLPTGLIVRLPSGADAAAVSTVANLVTALGAQPC